MKSIKIFAAAGAVALLGMAGLSSCKTNNGPENPYNGETVKTEFSIAIPEAGSSNDGGILRMPSTTIQKAGRSEFQGMTNITLIPFNKQIVAPATVPISAGNTRIGANISLGDIESASDLGTNSNAKVYTNVQIPLTTSSFLFYAKSKKTGTDAEIGSLTATATLDKDDPDEIVFDLKPIYENDAISSSTVGSALLGYLNSIANVEDANNKKWKEYTSTDDAGMKALFDTYASMHGLSSFEVSRVMTDLNNSLKPLDNNDDVSPNLPRKIRKAIAAPDYVTVNSTSGVVTLSDDYNSYPTMHGLPEGAVQIEWVASTTKAFQQTNYSSANITLPAKYTYPAQLWYFVNSIISTSNQSQSAKYNATNNWATILGAHTDAKAVNTKTRAVAIDAPIQYAVARLDVAARVNSSSLADNSESATGTAKAVTVPAAGFPITAVLIGGQRQVGFDFSVKDAGSTEYTIYDNVMTQTMSATDGEFPSSPAYNSTLVLESVKGTTPEISDVRIALELTNTTNEDFYGVDNQLIPKGGKFYVVATLTASSANVTENQVFKQDYTTTAKLTLKSLKNAYNTIPDLRTPKLEIGFSVDLTWKAGNVYTVDIN